MPSNTTLNSGSGGDVITTKERTHDGDATKQQGVFLSGVTGSEGSYTFTDVTAGGGVEATALRVTIASDSTGVLSVDDNGSTISVDDGGGVLTVDGTVELGATSLAALESLTTISTVTTVSAVTAISNALPAGTNNIGDVDVLSVVPGTGATSLGKAEDAAHSSGDTGVMALAVRRDADTTLAATDGDYVPLQCNASGSLKVAITAGAGSGGTSIADGASFTRDTTSITPVGGVVEASAPTVTAGDAVALSLTTGGAVRVAVASGGVAGVVEDAASAGGEEGVLILGVRRDTAASSSGTDGDFSTLNLDSTGRLHVNVGNTVTVGSHAVTNTGTFAVQVDGSALTALQLIDNTILVDDAAFTPGTSSVNMAGFQADETATDSVNEGDAGAARMTLDRKLIVTQQPHTAGGLTPFKSLDLDETEEEIKASAGQVYFVHAINLNAATRYLKFYNATAANVTVGTTTPVMTFPIPPNSTTGGGFVFSVPQGIAFGTAITVAATTGLADNDTGAPGANEVVVNIGYA